MPEIAKLCLNLLPVKISRENCRLFSGHGTCMYIGVRLNGSRTSAFYRSVRHPGSRPGAERRPLGVRPAPGRNIRHQNFSRRLADVSDDQEGTDRCSADFFRMRLRCPTSGKILSES